MIDHLYLGVKKTLEATRGKHGSRMGGRMGGRMSIHDAVLYFFFALQSGRRVGPHTAARLPPTCPSYMYVDLSEYVPLSIGSRIVIKFHITMVSNHIGEYTRCILKLYTDENYLLTYIRLP